jgi:hypothetical protein
MRSSVSTSTSWAVLGGATNLFGTGRALRQASSSKVMTMDVEQMADGSLLVLGTDRRLYTMANLTAPLVAVPVTDTVLVDRISAGPSEWPGVPGSGVLGAACRCSGLWPDGPRGKGPRLPGCNPQL